MNKYRDQCFSVNVAIRSNVQTWLISEHVLLLACVMLPVTTVAIHWKLAMCQLLNTFPYSHPLSYTLIDGLAPS